MKAQKLHKIIASLANVIDGVALGPNEGLTGAEIFFKPEATQAQKDAANALLASLVDEDLDVPEYGTRCTTAVLVDNDGRWQFFERRFGNEGQCTGDSDFSFRE